METVITVWQRQAKTKAGEFVWEHNHISDGFDEAAVTPPSTSAEQKAAWSKGTWRKLKAHLVNGKVVHVNHQKCSVQGLMRKLANMFLRML